MEDDDAVLLAAVRDGSQRAFNMLIDRHQQALRSFVRGLISGVNDADDIAQEAFLAAWTHTKSFKGQASVRSWLFGIAWRKAKDSQRWWFRRRQRDATYHELTSHDQDRQMAPADRLALHQALASLSREQRAVVMLCLGWGLSHVEAADALDMPLGTVKSHVVRGRARLREVLGEDS